jgi:hypothetical protein
MKTLSLRTAIGAMQIIARGGPASAVDTLGITEEDMTLTTGVTPWLATDRARVRKTIDSFIYGVIDVLGLPRMDLPAEYCAAVIATFIDPANYFPACSWITGTVTSEELIAGKKGKPVEGFERVSPSELFALVLELHGDADKTAKSYAAKTGAVIDRLKYIEAELVNEPEEVI